MNPFLLSALIGGAGQLIGGLFASKGQADATKAQGKATDKQLALSKEIFETNKEGAKPWVDAGTEALGRLQTKVMDGSFDLSGYGMDHLVEDPGYQFRLAEGEKALGRKASAAGKFLSGDQLKAAGEYGQEFASNEFGNAFARTQSERNAEYGRLEDMSGQGLSAQNAMAGVSTNFARDQNQIVQQGAQQAGNAAINTGNIWANAATGGARVGNQAIENYMLYDRLAQMGVG